MEVIPKYCSIVVREVRKEDAPKLLEYLDQVSGESDFLTFGSGEFELSVAEEEQFIENILKRDNSLFIVAEDKGKIVGNLAFSAGTRKRRAHVGEFGISVIKEYWGQGVGEELIAHLLTWSRGSNKIRKIDLEVRTDNVRAIKLYKKMGFVEEGLRKRALFVNNKFYDTLMMGLSID